ncbi:transposase family protein [Pseudofrankia asymbiotica]|uniref:Transposase n=1 Tax=Pseudofrankia asymbiotica TaxID=1834516 RepID=A0A1V2I889_9ACTN|nr:transposase family protein [Pseudofrankia asymbiotica]ONH28042.1 transposase [Pseudofrankia asymbiotica]
MSFTYTAELPLGDHTVFRLASLLVAERQRRGTRSGTRTLSTLEQAVMVLRWFCDGLKARQLFKDHGVSRSVGYRYLHEGVAVLAWRAPDLREALMRARIAGYDHVIIDGTVIETDRLRVPGPTEGVDLWWSGKAAHHGGNIQVLSAPDDGWPLWISDVRPGREHDSTALKASGALAILAEWTADLHEVLFDLGYEGVGSPAGPLAIAYKKPKGATLTDEQKAHNRIHNALRAVGERANALLKVTFRLLHNITIDPWKIGLVVKAALVILHTEYRRTA